MLNAVRAIFLQGKLAEPILVSTFLHNLSDLDLKHEAHDTPNPTALIELLPYIQEEQVLKTLLDIINLLKADFSALPYCNFEPIFKVLFTCSFPDAQSKAQEMARYIFQSSFTPERAHALINAWTPAVDPERARTSFLNIISALPQGMEKTFCVQLQHRMETDVDFLRFVQQILLPLVSAHLRETSRVPFEGLFSVVFKESPKALGLYVCMFIYVCMCCK